MGEQAEQGGGTGSLSGRLRAGGQGSAEEQVTKAVAVDLHLPLTEKEGKRVSEKISKSAPLL